VKNNFFLRTFTAILLAPIILIALKTGGLFLKLVVAALIIATFIEILNVKILWIKFSILTLFILFLLSLNQVYMLKNGNLLLIFFVTTVWLSDIGGYLFGKFFKGKKINKISPNKTYVGFLGSLIVSQFSIFILNIFNIVLFEKFYTNSFFIIAISVAVIIGDLLFSYFKRVSGVKDYSNLLPGHGGILDRIDGMILSSILFYSLLLIYKF
jgi:phosphatidate cytidylyltransferase